MLLFGRGSFQIQKLFKIDRRQLVSIKNLLLLLSGEKRSRRIKNESNWFYCRTYHKTNTNEEKKEFGRTQIKCSFVKKKKKKKKQKKDSSLSFPEYY